DVTILNSRDHGDLSIFPNVSTIVIGGTRDQMGRPTDPQFPFRWEAETFDIGNYDPGDDAIVPLDGLSAPPGTDVNSVNGLSVGPGVSQIDLVARVIAQSAASAAGELLGNLRTDASFDPGNFGNVSLTDVPGVGGISSTEALQFQIGSGPDGLFGTGDDRRPRFQEDDYAFNENGAIGTFDALFNLSFAASTGSGRGFFIDPRDAALIGSFGSRDDTATLDSRSGGSILATADGRGIDIKAPGGTRKVEVDLGGGKDRLTSDDDVSQRQDVAGGNGADRITTGKGNDTIRGGDGGDRLDGQSGRDTLRGNDGGDTLRGGNGADELTGGSGNDTLRGEKGKDTLTGGSGKDTFDFNARSDSGTTGSSRDDITDFSRGEDDVIDLRDLVSGRLDFRGDRNFQRNNDKQLRLEDTGRDIRVEIDFNGDRRSDFEIDVEDISRLRDSDFLL
ncbi:MAG: hypothetical protein AAFX39_02040, partial [Pseudomonadota bacterium]